MADTKYEYTVDININVCVLLILIFNKAVFMIHYYYVV